MATRFKLSMLFYPISMNPVNCSEARGHVSAQPRVWRFQVASLLGALILAGCTSTRLTPPAPVEDRAAGRAQAGTVEAVAPTAAPNALPPADPNAGQVGYYTVKPGDTLIRIGLESGQNWRDIARWNQIDNPNRIEVGQTLRVIPPKAGSPAVVAAKPGNTAGAADASAAAQAPQGAGVSTSPVGGAAVAAQPLSAPVAGAAVTPAAKPAAAAVTEEAVFAWPASGTVLSQFDGVKNKGISISGKAGDPVTAAGDGTVIFAGAGIRGYGNMIIIQHGATYITAYAHNQTILVKEDQKVKQGQKIAEMGSSDTDRVKLHFEVRRRTDGGKPVDPIKLLPKR